MERAREKEGKREGEREGGVERGRKGKNNTVEFTTPNSPRQSSTGVGR